MRHWSGLVWQAFDGKAASIATHTLNQQSGLKTSGHNYTAELADFYILRDGLVESQGSADNAGQRLT